MLGLGVISTTSTSAPKRTIAGGDIDQVFTDPSTSATDTFRLEGDWYGTVRGRWATPSAQPAVLRHGWPRLWQAQRTKESVNASNDGEYATWAARMRAGGWAGRWVQASNMASIAGCSARNISMSISARPSGRHPQHLHEHTDSVNDAWADIMEQKGSVDYRFGVARSASTASDPSAIQLWKPTNASRAFSFWHRDLEVLN